MNTSITGSNGKPVQLIIDPVPNICPVCKNHCIPIYISGYVFVHQFQDAQVIFRCPNDKCNSLFIARYEVRQNPPDGSYCPIKTSSVIQYTENRLFTENIHIISEDFCSIYNEAKTAEDNGLKQICGVGYRKALEYLVKDYLLKYSFKDKTDQHEKIKSSTLGQCLNTYIEEQRIKENAKRAAWLGNDETHYIRKWEDKDLGDLKRLIDMTCNWVDLVIDSDKYKESMPD